jgi:hypothetical protein
MYLQTDPEIESTWSSYGYAESNPVGMIDPRGRFAAPSFGSFDASNWRIDGGGGGNCTLTAEIGTLTVSFGFCSGVTIDWGAGFGGGGGGGGSCNPSYSCCHRDFAPVLKATGVAFAQTRGCDEQTSIVACLVCMQKHNGPNDPDFMSLCVQRFIDEDLIYGVSRTCHYICEDAMYDACSAMSPF